MCLCSLVVAPYCSFVVVAADVNSLAAVVLPFDVPSVVVVALAVASSAVSHSFDPSFGAAVVPFAPLAVAVATAVDNHFDRRHFVSVAFVAVPSLDDAAAAACPVAAAAAAAVVVVVRDFDYTQGNCHGRS